MRGERATGRNDDPMEYFLNGIARGAAFALISVFAIIVITLLMFQFG